MNSLEMFLKEEEKNLDKLIIGGGWTIDIHQGTVSNPWRYHDDVDVVSLDKELWGTYQKSYIGGNYFGTIFMPSMGWLSDFIDEKELKVEDKTYNVKVLCLEFISVSKSFISYNGISRDKDNADIEYIFNNFELDKDKMFRLMEKAGLLKDGSILAYKIKEKFGSGITDVDRFNRWLFKRKYGFNESYEIPFSRSDLRVIDRLLFTLKRNLGCLWEDNNKYILDTISKTGVYFNLEEYCHALSDSLKYSPEHMKMFIVKQILGMPCYSLVKIYGSALFRELSKSPENEKEKKIYSIFKGDNETFRNLKTLAGCIN